MSKARPKVMDALDAVSSDEDGDSSSEAASEPELAEQQAPAKKSKVEVTVEDLEKQGYKAGPSVLFIKPPSDQQQQDWTWSSGRERKEGETAEEDFEERSRTQAAAGSGVDEAARFALQAAARAQELREGAAEERARLAQERKLTFSQKEKRKRESGQASRGKNFVEEEKRLGRQHGLYSGFD